MALGAMQAAWFASAGAQEGRDDAVGREPCRLGTLLHSLPEDHWLHLFPRMVIPIPGLLQPHKLHSQVLNPFNSDCLAWFSSLAFSTDCSSKNSSFPFMVMH